MKPLPNTLPRYRSRWLCKQGILEYPIKGPIYLLDGKLYDSESTLKEHISNVSAAETTGVVYPRTGSNWQYGENSDVLVETQEWPWRTVLSGEDSDTVSSGVYNHDEERGVYWASKKISLPISAAPPLDVDRVLLPPNSITGDKVEVIFEQCSDFTTKNFPYYRDRGVSVHTPALIAQHGSDRAFTFFVKATKWSFGYNVPPPGEDSHWGPLSIIDSKFLRIDILGLETGLVSQKKIPEVFGMTEVSENEFTIDLADSTFSGLISQLEQFRLSAMDKASRGVMDVMVTFIELPKTARLIGDLLTNLRQAKTALRIAQSDTYFTPVRRNLLAKKWLEGRYGWRQIMFDAQGLMRLVAGIFKRYRRSYTSGTQLGKGMYLTSVKTEDLYISTEPFTIKHFSLNGQLRSGVATEPNLTDKWYKKFYHLIGGINPTAIIWELTRLSWIVDWFIDVGSLLTVLFKDPARYARAWHTLDVSYETGLFVINGGFAAPDVITDDAFIGATGTGYGLKQIFSDDEDIYELIGRGGRCRVYIRVPVDASRLPLVIPQGILIKGYSQIADMLSVLLVLRR